MQNFLKQNVFLATLVAITYVLGFLGFFALTSQLISWVFPVPSDSDGRFFWLIIMLWIGGMIGGWLVSMLPATFLNREHPKAHVHFGYLSVIAITVCFVFIFFSPEALSSPLRTVALPMLIFSSLASAYLLALRIACRSNAKPST